MATHPAWRWLAPFYGGAAASTMRGTLLGLAATRKVGRTLLGCPGGSVALKVGDAVLGRHASLCGMLPFSWAHRLKDGELSFGAVQLNER